MASIVSAASCGMLRQLLGMSKIYEYVTRSELLQVSLQFTINKLCGKESMDSVRHCLENCEVSGGMNKWSYRAINSYRAT